MVEEVLRQERYDILRAYSGTEAVMLLAQKRPDLILLNLILPGMTGEKELPLIKGIPFIVFSAKRQLWQPTKRTYCVLKLIFVWLRKKERIIDMKVLIINGSPHKGNTWKLVEQAKLDLLTCDKEIEFEEVHLMQEKIPFCIGCSNCFRVGHDKCPHYNVIGKLIEKIDNADGVIIASSTYNVRETALLKNFFDHLCFMLHRPHFFTSKALIITTAGGVGARGAAKSIEKTLKGIGFNRCYLFSKASISWNAYIPKDKSLHSLKRIVSKFYKDISSKKLHSPAISLLIPYNLFRGISLSYVPGTEYETEDGVHWTKECREKTVYAPEVKVFFLKKPIGYLFYVIGKKAGRSKKMKVTYRKNA